MRSSAFISIVCAFAFSCAFKDAQGLDQTKSVPSLYQHISRARKANIPNQIITAREAEPLTKCEKLLDEALDKALNQGIVGIYIPQCKEDGSFEPKQCNGSTSYCWCVDKNGNQTNGTLTRPGQELHCNEQGLATLVLQTEPLTKCEKLHKELLEIAVSHHIIGIFVPLCTEDGSFESKQCHVATGHCWCVDKNGNRINGTLTRPGQVLHCNEQDERLTKCEKLHNEALAKKEHGAMTIYVPQCTEDGSFEPKQCDGTIGYCWCVDENRKEILETRTKFGHVPPLECQQTSEEK